ncbi:response regulator transcription factor [Nocardiopsis rhodophaea]|uniref:response regulator transcription factor n=1 Tax=Nocardiopsis rhodophaea TaxID=280238 RepID=UPI0031DB1899
MIEANSHAFDKIELSDPRTDDCGFCAREHPAGPKVAGETALNVRWSQAISEVDKLTRREFEVFLLMAEGSSNLDIAHNLTISERTVRAHLSSIAEKLGIDSRMQISLAAYIYMARKEGIL